MSSHSTTSTPFSPPHTPPPSSPNFKLTLPTPPSFSAHRSSSHSRNTSSTNLADVPNTTQEDTKHSKRMSISSIHDPIVDNNDKKDRRVSFSIETHKPISRPSPSTGGELKPPIYKIPQRQNHQGVSEDKEETLNSPDLPVTPPSTTKRRPIPFQGVSPSASSRFSNMAALKGISIDQSLSSPRGAFSRSIWSAGILPSSSYSSAKSGWISPISGSSTPAAASKSILSTLKSPLPIAVPAGEPLKSPAGKKGTASEIAKARGLSIAIIKENGKGVLPITPGLTSSTTPGGGFKSPTLALALKSPEIKILQHIENGLGSAKSTGVPDMAGSIGKKEIILCKFYHTPGLTCTSRPCRFVHNLSSIQGQLGSAYPNTAAAALSGFRMLSPNQPDPTSGTFAHAQMTPSMPSDYPKKSLKVNEDGGMDLGDVMPGEKVLLEDENGEEVVGQVFFMSGGGKGAMGKSREKWKTVPCKDYAEGHCPYGDYCSFIHDEKLPAGILSEELKAEEQEVVKPQEKSTEEPQPETEVKPVQHRLTHRKSASLSSSLTAWTKALPKAILVPSVKVDPQILAKTEGHLSAFAPPFLKEPLAVDETGDLIPAIESVKATATTPPARAKEPLAIPMEPTITAPPKVTAWAKGPPPSLRKVASIKNLSLPPHEQGNMNCLTPTSANHLMPPVSAISMFGTESDPASPFDPVVQRRKLQELEDSLRGLPRSNLSERFEHPHEQPPTPNEYYNHPQSNTGGNGKSSVLNSTTYPWGMPMSPLPGHGDPTIPSIPGGLGVIWTPTGWAVQDAAMKNALRSAEVKARYGEDSKRRTAKNYFRTKPCRFFAEGFCPHGDECTYMHITVPSSPEQSSSGSESGGSIGISQTFSPTLSQGQAQVQFYGANPQQPQHHPKHQTLPCKFYNSSLGCNNGDRCNFLHTRVVPESVMMVERPRPWRTKPCRHFQLNRCTLGDACHFAHVLDPAWVNSGYGSHGAPQWNVGGGDGGSRLTEESLEKTLQEMRLNRNTSEGRGEEEEEEDEDDVEIVTAVGDMTFSSASYSPPSSVRA